LNLGAADGPPKASIIVFYRGRFPELAGAHGGASTNIIHTDMYGQIDIEITLDQAGILMLGAAPIAAAAGTLDTILSSTNYQFLIFRRYSNIKWGCCSCRGCSICAFKYFF